jgi:hypothetical protein
MLTQEIQKVNVGTVLGWTLECAVQYCLGWTLECAVQYSLGWTLECAVQYCLGWTLECAVQYCLIVCVMLASFIPYNSEAFKTK